MKIIVMMLALLSLSAYAVVDKTKAVRVAVGPGGDALAGTYTYDSGSPIYRAVMGGVSTDPFSGKTNKYAEAQAIRIVSTTSLTYVLGTSAVAAADISDNYLPANTVQYIAIDKDQPYLRVFGAGNAYITELK